MANPSRPFAKVPQSGNGMSSLLAEDASTIVDSQPTADTSFDRCVFSHQFGDPTINIEDDKHDPTTELYSDHEFNPSDTDNLTYTGFRPMEEPLSGRAARYLLTERRWSNADDSVATVGKKNLIIIFVCLATIEECLVCENFQHLLPVAEPFHTLMGSLGMLSRRRRNPRAYTFLQAIRLFFVRSRAAEIRFYLKNGITSPPEPNDLQGLDRMLLELVDRHIAFIYTKKPLASLCEPMSFDKVLRLRLIQVKNQLRDKPFVEQCFTTFVPTIPSHQQSAWQRPGLITTCESAQAKTIANQSGLKAESNPSNLSICSQCAKARTSMEKRTQDNATSTPKIPGVPADGSAGSSISGPDLPAGHPDALSGLQLFKTAVCQVHEVIRTSADSITFREFIGGIEYDIARICGSLQVRPPLPMADPADATGNSGIVGSELDVPLEHESIRSLITIGLAVIWKQWNDECFTEIARQDIRVEILEELRMIKEAADRVCSGQLRIGQVPPNEM